MRTEEAGWLQDPGGGLTENGSGCCAQKEELELSDTNMERDEHRNMTKNTDVSSPSPTDHREAKLPLSQYPKVTIKMFPKARVVKPYSQVLVNIKRQGHPTYRPI